MREIRIYGGGKYKMELVVQMGNITCKSCGKAFEIDYTTVKMSNNPFCTCEFCGAYHNKEEILERMEAE